GGVPFDIIRDISYFKKNLKSHYDEDDKAAFDEAAVKAALTERELKLEEMKNDTKKSNKNEKKTGFGGKVVTGSSQSISKDDVPF
ncbi:hypothetical protein MOC29_14250, partial [Bacillus paralicheniformis]|nr:hypothetical protein [Bacillus paralicheniformis]